MQCGKPPHAERLLHVLGKHELREQRKQAMEYSLPENDCKNMGIQGAVFLGWERRLSIVRK